MWLLISWLLNALALLITAYLVPGFHVADFKAALLAAVVLGLLNIFIKPILAFLSLPLTILTFGLFAFVINAIVLWLASALVPGLMVDSFLSALIGAVVLSVVSTILAMLVRDVAK